MSTVVVVAVVWFGFFCHAFGVDGVKAIYYDRATEGVLGGTCVCVRWWEKKSAKKRK